MHPPAFNHDFAQTELSFNPPRESTMRGEQDVDIRLGIPGRIEPGHLSKESIDSGLDCHDRDNRGDSVDDHDIMRGWQRKSNVSSPAKCVTSDALLPCSDNKLLAIMSGRISQAWWIALTLAITEPVSWGILYYAFTVFIEPIERDLGWSRTQLTGAFSLALLTSGVAAVPFGRWLDRHGPRVLMTAGSVFATALVLAWARVESYPMFVLIWILIGVCMAATFYEPAFSVVTSWFTQLRSRALTLVTFGGGFASVVFIPLAAWLVDRFGWREALVGLAVILGMITIPLHAVMLRPKPQLGNADSHDRSDVRRRSLSMSEALRSASFRWLSTAFSLAMFVNVAVLILLIPLLLERGESARFAASAAATIGLLALPGRLILTPLGDWVSPFVIPACIFGVQATAILVLVSSSSRAGVWVFVVLFGLGFGAITPARASMVADMYGVAAFASISGVLAMVLTFARAAGPVGGSWIWTYGGDESLLLGVLAGMSLLAAGAVILAVRHGGRAG
ncbi:hypothetical protein BH23CHL5_BH23CHL5_24050 [soil metagenome]